MQSDCWFRLEVASPSKYAMAQAQPCSQLLHLNALLHMCLLHGFPLKMLFALYLPSFSLSLLCHIYPIPLPSIRNASRKPLLSIRNASRKPLRSIPTQTLRIFFLLRSLPRFLCLTLQPNSQPIAPSTPVNNRRSSSTAAYRRPLLTTYGASSSSRSRWTLPATTNGVNGKQTHDATAFDNSSVFPLFGLSEVGYNKRGFGSFWVRFNSEWFQGYSKTFQQRPKPILERLDAFRLVNSYLVS
uniref:Uncharacterized protein n=1 Tax=Cucumis sativus TaxID=3659 RepID=A0A0A0LN07_CUCSA